jgi:3-oxoacyl-[acyl-carrier-protein] synthase II
MKFKPSVVLTGGGVLSGLGVGIEPFWQGLRQNQSAITVKDVWNVPDLATNEAIFYAPCAEFVLAAHVDGLRPPFPLRYSQLAMVGCRLAINHAGLDLNTLVPEQLGLILDTTLSANAAAEAFLYKLYQDGPAKVSPFVFTKTTTNCALGDVARAFKLKGPSSILLGENSVCYGYDLIRDGKADVVICGGFDEIRETTLLANLNRGYLPPVMDASGRRRSFTESLCDELGTIVYGEGAAFAVLESAEHAQRRGAAVLAEVLDYQVSGDSAYRDFIYERSADDLLDHLTEFCQNSQIDPASVNLFVGGGGLPWHIRNYEAPALYNLWTNDSLPAYVNIKGRTGETFSGSPVMSLLTGALCLRDNVVVGSGYTPVQTGLPTAAPEYTIDHTFAAGSTAFVHSLHVGGNAVTIALRKP